jgi:Right handed beta helix region
MKSNNVLKKVRNILSFQSVEKRKMVMLIMIQLILIVISGCGEIGDTPSSTLPGSRPIINAGQYPSIQAAINALPSEGGIVNLPPGEFKITNPLTINQSDVYLKGSGTATQIINSNTNHLPALLISSESLSDTSNSGEIWRFQISDLRITGNKESGHGILAKNVQEIYIEGITVSNNGGDGIKMDNCRENPRITHSNITYNKGTGLNLIGCHDIVVNGNEFEENNDALHCIDGYNLAMSGNNIDDHLSNGVVIENTYGSVVSGNMIEECNGMAIILDRDCYGINLGSNVIAHNGGGVKLEDAHGISVSANTFTINKSHAIYFGPESGRITVSGNNFANSYIGEGKVKRDSGQLIAGGVIIDGGRNILFSGNVFAGIQPDKAFKLQQQTNNILFGNNMLIDVRSDHEALVKSLVNDNLVANE